MSNKRSYSAFLSSAPAGASDTANGFDAPQLHAQQSTTSPSPCRHIPGAWPEGPSVFQHVAPEPPSTSVFTTVGQWVATMSISTLLSLPRYIANSFLRPQTIKAVSIISSTGSNKRRFVAACSAEDDVATPSPSERARAHQARHQNQSRAYSSFAALPMQNHTISPQQNRNATAPVQSTTQLPITNISLGPEPSSTSPHNLDTGIDDDDADTSIDFSFDDILTSTPPRNSQTGSPLHISWNSPRTLLSASHASPVLHKQSKPLFPLSSRSSQLPLSVGQVSQKPVTSYIKGRVETARNTYRAPKKPTVTPLRRQLVKLQFGTRQQRLETIRQAESLIESADQGFTEPEPTKITPTEVVDQDLSYLPDAPSPLHAGDPSKAEGSSHDPDAEIAASEFEYENDLSFLADAPSPRRVRWTKHAGTKSFYYDEKVSDMLDSTLEIIHSSPVRGVWHNFQYDEQTQSDETSSTLHSSSADGPKAAAVETQIDDGGFHGVPPDTFDASDDSLEESALSLELVQDLQNEFKAKLALAPPPPPPPKPLITPLSAEETEILHTAAANTSNGLKADKWVIEQKLYARDFATLLPRLFNGDPRAWLNDNIVNEYLSILVAAKKKEAGFVHKRGGPAPPVHAFSSFWYSTADTSRWSNRFQLKGKQYLDAQLILYPICDRGHWRLLAVYPQKRSIEYLDSMSLSGEEYLDKLDEYLKKELGDLYVADEWTKGTTQRSTQQMNGSDCGVFTLLNALALLRGDDTNLVLATDGMDEARKRIAATLLAGHPTTELD